MGAGLACVQNREEALVAGEEGEGERGWELILESNHDQNLQNLCKDFCVSSE